MCTYTHIYTHIYHGGSRARELPFISRVVKFVSILMGFGRLTCHVYFFVNIFLFRGLSSSWAFWYRSRKTNLSCIYICMHTFHIHVCVSYACMYTYTRMCLICVYIHIYTYVSHMRVYTRMCLICVYIHKNAYISYVYIWHVTRVCVCMCVYTHTCIQVSSPAHFHSTQVSLKKKCVCVYASIHTYIHTSPLTSSFSLNVSVSKETGGPICGSSPPPLPPPPPPSCFAFPSPGV